MKFCMSEFSEHSGVTVEHRFKVDEQQKKKDVFNDIIIGADLMWNMGIDIQYSEERIRWDDEYIPMKTRGTLMDYEYC